MRGLRAADRPGLPMVQRGVPEENGTTTAGAAEDMRKVWDGAPCEPAQVVLGGVQEASGASTPTVIDRRARTRLVRARTGRAQ